MKQAVCCFEKCKIIALGRRSTKSISKSLHVGAPNLLRRNVNQKLKCQRLLVIELIHIRRRHLVRSASTDILPDSTTHFVRVFIEIKTFVSEWSRGAEHRSQCDVRQGGKWRKQSRRWPKSFKQTTALC